MKNVHRVSVAVISGVVVLGALQLRAAEPKADLSKLPPAAAKAGLTYEKDIKALVEKSCLKCHSGEKPKGQYGMATRDALIKGGGERAPAIKPGRSTESPFLLAAAGLIQDLEMPPTDKRDQYPALTREQLAVVRAWVDQGAK